MSFSLQSGAIASIYPAIEPNEAVISFKGRANT